jgi:sugar (glycoside-pentoside-hexuronide) transporter
MQYIWYTFFMENTIEKDVVNETAVASDVKLRTFSKKEQAGYLTSMFGQNMIFNIVNFSIMYFLQFTLFIPAAAVGAIMIITRALDACTDPIMGTLVDRTKTKLGKCIPYLKYAPIPIALVTALAFTSFGLYPDVSAGMQVGMIIWAGFIYFFWSTAYTVGDIPLWGVVPLMTECDKQRNKLLSVARIFGGAGAVVIMFSMQPVVFAVRDMLTPSLGGQNAERWAFFIVAAVYALVAGALFQVCGFMVKEKVKSDAKKPSFKQNLKIMWRNKPFRRVFLSGILGSPRMLLMVVAMPLISYYFASRSAILTFVYMGILGGGMFVGQFVFMLLTPQFLKKFSKKQLYNWSHFIMIAPFVLIFVVYLIAPTNLIHPAWLAAISLLYMGAGAGFGLTTVLQSLMIADAIDYEEYHYGHRPDGVFFSGQTFIAKLSSGIAAGLSAIGYAIVGFSGDRIQALNQYMDAGGIPRENPEYTSFMFILFFLVSIPPAIGCILGVLPTLKYELNDKEHAKIITILNERRHKKEVVEE